jgi:hypothetical protein
LKFNHGDFDQPATHDIIFNYYKTNYPKKWEEICSILLEMRIDEFRTYYRERQAFYNK